MLDARLKAVLQLIRAASHADIGTDHAALPLALIRSGRCQNVIAVELNAGPLQLALAAVGRAGLSQQIEVRQGDGFAPVAPQEIQSASLTGMGARTILGILGRAEWLPPTLILQPNAEPEALRAWAQASGYHLKQEALAPGFWRYPVLSFEQTDGADPAYWGLPAASALKFGPHLLRSADPHLQAELHSQERRLSALAVHGRPSVMEELRMVRDALAFLPDALTPAP
ncbi:tRNA (adenine-N(1))-methyltransferase [Deinococcus detaillensis]|uniref:tRNA (Adenine-N(1))-methyltransferase n=1 Tax=Deinococcus detaillensis TaxID=2592048 RepID=A0A553V7H1_9DEIO|nr:tRNA (adenine(22)-N(1))-methyltransferase TrmK [Deinococcus detaillensis]TSA88131.1 tRNA (adenine-N(1))-methyltransferase [Deinococcus detaillensis]